MERRRCQQWFPKGFEDWCQGPPSRASLSYDAAEEINFTPNSGVPAHHHPPKGYLEFCIERQYGAVPPPIPHGAAIQTIANSSRASHKVLALAQYNAGHNGAAGHYHQSTPPQYNYNNYSPYSESNYNSGPDYLSTTLKPMIQMAESMAERFCLKTLKSLQPNFGREPVGREWTGSKPWRAGANGLGRGGKRGGPTHRLNCNKPGPARNSKETHRFGNKKLDNQSKGSSDPAAKDRAADNKDKQVNKGMENASRDIPSSTNDSAPTSSTSSSSSESSTPTGPQSTSGTTGAGTPGPVVRNPSADKDTVMANFLNQTFNFVKGDNVASR
ncbi:hypothetical protein Agabi119p4_4970 [Agaricus bisporus var. burnettii]|uniref:Uncharacterized protein n=1 Tax=Agaricus bisporus var. burnettii TaxID=192524 RepID=A0A8H7F4E4_AGABI|nr:hypothetical protein Agabi119p4_4970 [Agaricus bisporus var. burnettii]